MAALPPDDDMTSRGAHAVRALLERHGIPKHRHSSFVGEFFELSRAAAHQRVSRSTAWTLEELTALAEHFGETLVHVVAPLTDAAPHLPSPAIKATLCLGATTIPCRIWLRPENVSAPGDVFVALRTGGDYLVMPVTATPDTHALRISRLEVDQTAASARRVAVWTKDSRSGKKLSAQLHDEGMSTSLFSSAADLLDGARQQAFQGYVIDWPVPDGDAHDVLSALREAQQSGAIVLTCDRMRSDSKGIADLALAATKYRAQVLEKPVQLPLLVSALRIRISGS